jgi:hypothetical protein
VFETWTPTLREENRLRVFQNGMLRKIFGPKREEEAGGWKILYSEISHGLYYSQSIIRMKSSMRWAGHVARME